MKGYRTREQVDRCRLIAKHGAREMVKAIAKMIDVGGIPSDVHPETLASIIAGEFFDELYNPLDGESPTERLVREVVSRLYDPSYLF